MPYKMRPHTHTHMNERYFEIYHLTISHFRIRHFRFERNSLEILRATFHPEFQRIHVKMNRDCLCHIFPANLQWQHEISYESLKFFHSFNSSISSTFFHVSLSDSLYFFLALFACRDRNQIIRISIRIQLICSTFCLLNFKCTYTQTINRWR